MDFSAAYAIVKEIALWIAPDATMLSLIAVTALISFAFYQSYKADPGFDPRRIVMDEENGRVSLSKMAAFCALVVSTWGFALLIVKGEMTEFYFLGYMGIWPVYATAMRRVKDKGVAEIMGKSELGPDPRED